MDIPANLLNVLKCFICEGYLSCGPIFILENGKATCGRCNLNTVTSNKISETKTRNYQYEELASIFQFPCQFSLHGCPEKLIFSEEQPHHHEHSCSYQPYICPINSKNQQCDWRGPWNNLLEHCEQSHPDNIAENPFSSEPNFAENSFETHVIPCFDTLFILRINISLMSERVVYSLFLLDDPCKTELYNFTIDCKRNNLFFSKPGKIGTTENLVKQKPLVSIISQQVLLMQVGGVAGTIITINLKKNATKTKCKFCSMQNNNIKDSEWICSNCELNLKHCHNKTKDCMFKDTNAHKVEKHENYFCKYINKCFDCSGPINAGKVFQHFDGSNHENTVSSKVGVTWKATETPKRILNYVLLKSKVIDRMFCKYYLDARQFSLILCSTHSSDQLCLYKCSVEIVDEETKYRRVLYPELVLDYFWDWRLDVDFDMDIDVVRYGPVELDVTIIFERINLNV